jgi:hypothetical protein
VKLFARLGIVAVVLLSSACSENKREASVAPTFTPAPRSSAARRPGAQPAHPVVGAACLRSLNSYRFSGSFALKPALAGAEATPSSGDSGALTGSLANLLGNVSFQGSALAPDRYQAQVTFGGDGVQGLEIMRLGTQTFTRFGAGGWQTGDAIQGLGGISGFDPENLCERSLAALDTAGQTPAREVVNGIASLRYEVNGPQIGRSLTGVSAGARAQAPGVATAQGAATVWVAESGGYPTKFQVSGRSGTGSIELQISISDVNGKDIQINPPA